MDPSDRSQSPHASPSISTPLTQHPRSSSRPRHGGAPRPPPVSLSRTHDTQQCPLAGREGAGTVVLDGGTEERDGHLPDRRTVWLALLPLITIGVTHHHDGPQPPPLRFPPPTGGSEKGGGRKKENRDKGTGARHQEEDNALEIPCNGGGAQGLRGEVISLRFLVPWDREEARDRNARPRLAHLRRSETGAIEGARVWTTSDDPGTRDGKGPKRGGAVILIAWRFETDLCPPPHRWRKFGTPIGLAVPCLSRSPLLRGSSRVLLYYQWQQQ